MLQLNYSGRVIGEFTLYERIGRGGMAAVYRAVQHSTGREVAFKVITLDPALDLGEQAEFRQRFAQEAAVVSQLEHPNLVPIYSYDVLDNDIAYLAMRLMRGGTLADELGRGALPVERAVGIFAQIAGGLHYAHEHGIVHRDLKPNNILFDDIGNAYLTDFGLAKLVEQAIKLTQSGTLVGTPMYVAPEQFYGAPVTPKADIYSLGVLLYHMLTGRPPFDDKTGGIYGLIRQHAEADPPAPRSINPALSPELEQVVLRALRKHPAERYESVQAMLSALLGATATRRSSMTIPRLRLPFVSRATRRRVAGILLAALVLGIGVGVAFNAWARRPLPPPVVAAGMVGSPDDVVASPEQISAASMQLGSGFIGYIACNLTTAINAVRARLYNDFAREYGLELRMYDADTAATRQPDQIALAVAEGARVLIVCPISANTIDTALRAAADAGVPIVLLSPAGDTYNGVVVTWDNLALGTSIGHAAGELVRTELNGEADVLLVEMPELPGVTERAEQMIAALREYAPNAVIIGRLDGQSVREVARDAVAAALAEGADPEVVLSINDAGAFGAIEALETAGYTPDEVAVFGINGEALALDYIRRGYFMRATVANDIELHSRTVMHTVVQLLTGGTVPETVLIPPQPALTRQTLASESTE